MARASTVTPTSVTVDAPSDLATLIEQRRALAEQIKQVKAAQKAARAARTSVKLASDIVRRLSARARTRIASGQSVDDALDLIFSAYRDAVARALASEPARAAESDETSA